jgi:hypothetical protein
MQPQKWQSKEREKFRPTKTAVTGPNIQHWFGSIAVLGLFKPRKIVLSSDISFYCALNPQLMSNDLNIIVNCSSAKRDEQL